MSHWNQARVVLVLAVFAPAIRANDFATHPPTRPLPVASDRPMAKGPAWFVDPAKGNDAHAGSKAKPWKTLQHAVDRLKPGATLYLRGGIYREHVTATCNGTADQPITIRSYPGELAILDGGIAEFWDSPDTAWEPCPGGAAGEFRSTKTFPDLGGTIDHTNVLGNFGDSMIPLHGYRFLVDLRSDTMYWKLKNNQTKEEGIYCGPGVFYDTATGRIHIRLAHTPLPALGADNYRGETDPRKLKLVIAGFKGGSPLTLRGASHVRVQDIVVRGARLATVDIDDCNNVEFNGCTVFAGQTAFLVRGTNGLRLINTACRGIAAPWTFRGSLKYRAIEARIFSASGWNPTGDDNRNFELAYCEFTDSVDGIFIGNVRTVRFHHNVVDNISDDGIFLTARSAYDGTTPGGDVHIYQNYLVRCLTTFAFGVGHGRQKALAGGRQTGTGVHIFRNVFDFRRPVMYHQPNSPQETELFSRGRFAGDHGGPLWEPMFIYHNTIVADDGGGYYYGTLGLADHVAAGTQRRIFNNIIAQCDTPPRLIFKTGDIHAGHNLLWTAQPQVPVEADFFGKFRSSKTFAASKAVYQPGWTTGDVYADPRFKDLPLSWRKPMDLRLAAESPAKDMGIALPKNWPDPLRDSEAGEPDAGALPVGATPWRVGVNGRWSMFGGPAQDPGAKVEPIQVATHMPFPAKTLARPRDTRPVAVVQGYPAFDAPIVEFLLRRQGVPVVVHERTWLEPREYGKYRAVIVVGSLARGKVEPRAFSKEDLPRVTRFLESGGTLMLMRNGREVVATDWGRAFLTKLIGTSPREKDVQLQLLQPGHPWVKHLRADQPHAWLERRGAEGLAASQGERIVGTPAGITSLLHVPVAKGRLIYVGWDIASSLPHGRKPSTVEMERLFEEQVQILANIVDTITARQ